MVVILIGSSVFIIFVQVLEKLLERDKEIQQLTETGGILFEALL